MNLQNMMCGDFNNIEAGLLGHLKQDAIATMGAIFNQRHF